MEPLRPAVGQGFRFRKDLLPTAAHPYGALRPPTTPPPVSHVRLLAHVHNPALRRIIATDRARERARTRARVEKRTAVSPEPPRRMRMPEPDVTAEWETLQQARPSQVRRAQQMRQTSNLQANQTSAAGTARVVHMPQPPAAISRTAARQEVRAAFELGKNSREYWDGGSATRRSARLQPPARLAMGSARMAGPGATAVWPTPSPRKPLARLWVPH
jgi:hypothetical protein